MASDNAIPQQAPEQAPPEWEVTVRRVTKDDGRYLIYYEFQPSALAPEIELQRTTTPGEEQSCR
ncbi:MAG: hypothetical protein ACUVX9_16155 [Anaerolineae bacterium]